MKTLSEAARENARLRAKAWYAANKTRASEAARAYREANAEAIKAQKRAAYEAIKDDPEFKAKVAVNTLKAKSFKPAYDREYRLKNAAKLEALKAEWRANNADLIRAVKSAYKAKRRTQVYIGDSAKVVRAWLASVAKICVWCDVDCEESFHIDHFYPLAKGGEHRVTNLVIACPECNVKKSALLPEEFCSRNGLDFSKIERHRCDVGMLS